MRFHRGVLPLFGAGVVGITLFTVQCTRREPIPSLVSPAECWNPGADIGLTGTACGPVQPLQLSCAMPSDMQFNADDLNTSQRSADVFSWQEFIALNWPAKAGARGEPDWSKDVSAPGPRVWETWKEGSEVYLAGGAAPPGWNAPETSACSATGGKTLVRTSKVHDGLDEKLQAAASNGLLPATLTDQAGRLVRFEIRFNKIAFDYIVGNKFYDSTIQAKAASISYPSGAALIKAAWREVTREDEGRFHSVDACVCDPGPDGSLVNCSTAKMGLVGLHIMQKTPSAPEWIWSTFEHIDNVPGPSSAGPYSFNGPASAAAANAQTKPGTPNQIFRTTPIPSTDPVCSDRMAGVDNVRQMNADVRAALGAKQSVFAKYELVNTQWRETRPLLLANTTMESFVQRESSCLGCHQMARSSNLNSFVSADFSFTLNNAKPTPASCRSVGAPKAPANAAERAAWPQIMRGYQIATATYETLPKAVPQAKLHCTSCHLDGGGNSSAAWWVGLKSEYPTTPALQARINHCFTNSMNGNALCTPASGGSAGTCDTNADMTAMLRYIQWLDDQAAREGSAICPAVSHGYPALPTLTGDAARGATAFTAKCAFCHGADGQGRYEDDTYFRPALWGPRSFNTAAGMFSDPALLAGFIRWNMPLGSGGSISDQEAWDLQAFLHAKPRPKR